MTRLGGIYNKVHNSIVKFERGIYETIGFHLAEEWGIISKFS